MKTFTVVVGSFAAWTNVTTPQFSYPIPNGTSQFSMEQVGQGSKPIDDLPAPGCSTYKDYFSGTMTGSNLGYRVLHSGETDCGMMGVWQPGDYLFGWDISVSLGIPIASILNIGPEVTLTEMTNATQAMQFPPGGQEANKKWRYEVWQKTEDVAINIEHTRVYYTPDGQAGYSEVKNYVYSGTCYFKGLQGKLDVKCCGT